MSYRQPSFRLKSQTYWRQYGDRLRLARLVLQITEAQAADAAGVTLKTYKKWEAGTPHRQGKGFFRLAEKYDISLDWLGLGEGGGVRNHLVFNRSKFSILPVMTRWRREAMRKHQWRTHSPVSDPPHAS